MVALFKNDVLSTGFSFVRYTEGMENITGLGMKKSLNLPVLTNKHFNNLTIEQDETIYTYNGESMRYFVRKALKVGRCSAFNQYYKSPISDKVFTIISTGININVSV